MSPRRVYLSMHILAKTRTLFQSNSCAEKLLKMNFFIIIADSHFQIYFAMIPKYPKLECQTWPETPKTGFLIEQLILDPLNSLSSVYINFIGWPITVKWNIFASPNFRDFASIT